MKVKFSSEKTLAGKKYSKGVTELADKFAYSQAFKALVKAGHVAVLPKDKTAQAIQAQKDTRAAQKAQVARRASQLKPASKIAVAVKSEALVKAHGES